MATKTFNPVLSPSELKEMLTREPRTRLLDVRTPGEFESVHIRGAYNVPLDRLSEHAEEIRKVVTDPVVLVCRSGSRARKAEESLEDHGISNLHVLDGGVDGWIGADGHVERGRERLSLERQVRIAAGLLAGVGGALALVLHPLFALVPTLVGGGLVFAGITDTCGMAIALSRLPYNRPESCDVDEMVRALRTGAAAPAKAGVENAGSSTPVRTCAG